MFQFMTKGQSRPANQPHHAPHCIPDAPASYRLTEPRRRLWGGLLFSVLGLGWTLAPNLASAADYPDRPITLVAPFPPGASADGIARVIAESLTQSTGVPVIVENRPGGAGVIGMRHVANSDPDGYTITMGAPGAVVVYPYTPDADNWAPQEVLRPIAQVAGIPLVITTHKDTGIESLKDFLEQAQNEPNGLSYGNTGQFTAQHLSGELLAQETGAPLVAVPYRGSAPAITDLLGGQIPAAITDLTSADPHIKEGSLVALAVTAPKRSTIAPDIPTVAEAADLPDYAATAWMGLFAPKDTPDEVVERLSADIQKALEQEKVQTRIKALAAEPLYASADEFGSLVAQEAKQWQAVIEAIGN